MPRASVQVVVESNAAEIRRAFGEIARRQVPFATAKALTLTARDAKDDMRKALRERFTLRNTWTERGVLSTKALKRDWPRTHATVYVDQKRAYLADHERGRRRRTRSGHRFAIPTRAIRRTKRGKVSKAKWPGRVLARPTVFLFRDPGLGGKGSIRQRTTRRQRLAILYWLRRTVRIKGGTLRFRETVTKAARRHYARHFPRELEMAIRTAKHRHVRGRMRRAA